MEYFFEIKFRNESKDGLLWDLLLFRLDKEKMRPSK